MPLYNSGAEHEFSVVNSQPMVSKGNGSTQIPKKITISKRTIVAV